MAGHLFDEVRVELTRATALLWCDAVGVPFEPANLHPSLAYYVAMEGVRFAEVFRLAQVEPQDMAVAGEISVSISRPVALGVCYVVSGGIATVEEKEGRELGPFEMMVVQSSVKRLGGVRSDFVASASILLGRAPSAAP